MSLLDHNGHAGHSIEVLTTYPSLGGEMRRREFITLIGGVAASWPVAGHTQLAESVRRIGMLIGTFAKADRKSQDRIAAFLDTFQKLGWSDGRNFRVDCYWGAGNTEEIAVTAKELLRAMPDVIVVVGNAALAELRRQTSTHLIE